MMKTLKWTGKKGNEIELRATCETKMVADTVDLDGYVIERGTKPYTEANLELWVDGKKVDECWNTSFWRVIELSEHPEYRKVWGLNLAMTIEQAEIVEAFLKEVIESGKAPEVKEAEEVEKAEELAEKIEIAEAIVKKAEKTIRNTDGTLMNKDQAYQWIKNYNNLHNEGAEGYIPEIITQESYDWAREILSNVK